VRTKLFYVPRFVKWLYPQQVWRFESNNSVYLTFDDGPHPEITPRLLDILEQHDVKATFFLLGKNIEQYPELYDAIKQRHAIGNHGYEHLDGKITDTDVYLSNFRKGMRYQTINYFRPPYGRITQALARTIGRESRLAMWSWLSYDYDAQCPNALIQKNLDKHIRPGDIMVYHENDQTIQRFESLVIQAIETIKKKGYSFAEFPKN